MLKRYLLFQFDSYDPNDGWNSCKGDFDSKEEALIALAKNTDHFDHFQIIDTETKTIIEEN